MAGHSQFKNIMHRKGRVDAVRAKVFGKLAREITVAAKLGTPDPAMNPRLRAAILAARAENMPKDNIERAIRKAQGGDAENYEEIRYEGYGPGGAALIVEAMTDNRNRTASDIRSSFTRNGGNLAETGAVSSCSTKSGRSNTRPRRPMPSHAGGGDRSRRGRRGLLGGRSRDLLRAGALARSTKALEARFGEPSKAALVWRPQTTVAVDDEAGEKLLRSWRRSRTTTTCRTSTATSRSRTRSWPGWGRSASGIRQGAGPWPRPGRSCAYIGLDPGLRRTGWGVIGVEGAKIGYVASGVVTSDAELPLPGRLGSSTTACSRSCARGRPTRRRSRRRS